MFGKGSNKKTINYDTAGKTPVIRASICTGEKVAGFKDQKTGRFEECMVIRGEKDMRDFLKIYGVEESQIKKEW